ncbi:hypothetical protein [Microbacterium oleivorans]|uniref:hypothetical protein n=1 Tax=Microbacterium oleivorans TaxID=273677 RepID=UPI0007677B7F|nr:hypothetical protein [Microbacterium oleivorans]THE08483.1 hypothetical protein E1I21_02215 [Microbacterium oleivorans]
MSTADARIRRFSTITWLGGSAVAVVLAFVIFPFVGINPATGELLLHNPNDYEYRPWTDPDAQEVRVEGGEVIGTAASGYLDLSAGDDVWVVGPLRGGEERSVGVYHQRDTRSTEGDARPAYLGSISGRSSEVLVAGETDGRVWFAPRLNGWRADLTRETPISIEDGVATGEGSALLSYTGDALSARFTFEGEGFFIVDALFPGEVARLVRIVDSVDVRQSWPAKGRVIFRVEADEGSGPWKITLDEPATGTP